MMVIMITTVNSNHGNLLSISEYLHMPGIMIGVLTASLIILTTTYYLIDEEN